MSTFVYSPSVTVIIDSYREGQIDVTKDLVRGSVNRVENGVSSARVALANTRRKYDRVFAPNDRIVIGMKRVRPIQVFAGYLDSVPLYSAMPRTINLTASCSLKRLQFFHWDPGTQEAFELLNRPGAESTDVDGGIRERAKLLLTDVAGWNPGSIHIGAIPANWIERSNEVYETIGPLLSYEEGVLGMDSAMAGDSLAQDGTLVAKGIGPGTGTLPVTSGSATDMPGVGQLNLSGESRSGARDRWFAGMRWSYLKADGSSWLDTDQERAARGWWKNRRILVTNPRKNTAVVLRAAHWLDEEGADIGMSSRALQSVLQAAKGDVLQIRFAPEDANLGEYRPANFSNTLPDHLMDTGGPDRYQTGGSFGAGTGSFGNTLPDHLVTSAGAPGKQFPEDQIKSTSSLRSMWDPPCGAGDMTGVEIGGMGMQVRRGTEHAWRQLSAVLDRHNYRSTESAGGAYNCRTITGGSGYSLHAYGIAVDINPSRNPYGKRLITDMPPAMIREIKQIRTASGAQVFGWGGDFRRNKDAMHFQINVSPEELGGSLTAGRAGGGGAQNMFNPANLWGQTNPESNLLAGVRALMNDRPILPTISQMLNTSMRSFCSAPNGDFIAWFPDYFGVYGTAARMVVKDIELQDFTVDWSDQRLKTHVFTAGTATGVAVGGAPQEAVDINMKFRTHGIASVEMQEILRQLLNIPPEADPLFGDPATILDRFGARPHYEPMGLLYGERSEFWYATYLFMRNWAQQFSASVPLTFMPELYPGMLLQIPSRSFQAYVTGVSHNFDLSGGSGFTTSVQITSPSATDREGVWGLPRAGIPEEYENA